jgi:hypothetical protein
VRRRSSLPSHRAVAGVGVARADRRLATRGPRPATYWCKRQGYNACRASVWCWHAPAREAVEIRDRIFDCPSPQIIATNAALGAQGPTTALRPTPHA